MGTAGGRSRAGFVALELTAVVMVLGVACALLMVAASGARHGARVAGSTSNLQRFASGISAFGADNEDKIVSFWWQPGQNRAPDGYVFPLSSTAWDAASDQAISAIRHLGGRTDVTAIRGWVPHILYNHLALADYLQQRLPAEFFASPSDHNRLAWQRAARNYSPGEFGQSYFDLTNRPSYPQSGNTEKRWQFSSSYHFVPASYAPDARILSKQGTIFTLSQGSTHRQVMLGSNNMPWAQRRLSEISYPGNKVVVFEHHSGDLGAGRYYYAFDQVKAPMLFGDGSVSVRSMADANPGFQPNSPFSANPTRFSYDPELSWEPPTVSGAPSQFVSGRVQWTRSGLRGRDFGGPEVPWVD